MRNIKRFICLILVIICAFCTAFAVSAANNTHYISELQMSVDIPDYMSVRTRDTAPDMTEGIYLEATSNAPDLDVRVLMQKDEKTEEFFNLSLLSSSALREYKEALLANPEYSDCTEGEYGGVLFLDFSTYDTVGDTTVYGRQSVTVVNGMSIVISSTSDSDALTSDELELIKGIVSSVKFDKILSKPKDISFWSIFIPVIIVLIVAALGFLAFSYFMGKKSREAKKRRRRELERKADYDVLKRADDPKRKAQSPEGLGGYKTSSAFFEDAFSGGNTANDTSEAVAQPHQQSAVDSMVKSSKQAVKSTGYFFTNLKRELKKNNKKKTQAKRKSASKKQKSKPQDFDVFSDKF